MKSRLAIICTHPIQYYAPWFAYLTSHTDLTLCVFYLSDAGLRQYQDQGFGIPVCWDIPLLNGYDYKFVHNASPDPGTSHFIGLWNPGLTSKIMDFNPDAVLLTSYNYATLLYFLWRWSSEKIPLIFRGDSHRIVPETGPLNLLKRQILIRLFRRFSAALFVGAANREYFKYHLIPDERLFFSPHAVDSGRFNTGRDSVKTDARLWKQSLAIPDDHRVILFAGKFEDKKRPVDLLKAFILADLKQVSLLYVGAGKLERQLRQLAQGNPYVYFAPFQNQSLMPRTYAACDVFVLPSMGRSETWGMAVNEAMSMGRPAIVSNHVGCAQDLVIDGETGMTFPAGDVEALGKCLQEALSRPDRPRIWGENAIRRIQRYSYEEATKGLLLSLRTLNIEMHTL